MSVIASGCGTTGGGGGTGDVVGPASATDNAAARYDGPTGKLLKGSLVIFANDGEITTPAGITAGGDASLQGVSATDVDASGTVTAAILKATNQLQTFNGAALKVQINDGGLNMAADCQLRATNGGEPGGSGDTGQKRDSGATWLDTDCTGGLGFRLTGRPVEASTAGSGAPNLIAVTESRKLLTNEGAAAEAYNTLPASAPVGYEQAFYCQDSDGIRIVAPTGCTIRLGPGSVSAAAGFVRSVTVGSALTLIKINSTEFVCLAAPLGTWLIDL